jgi:hypothetical protein
MTKQSKQKHPCAICGIQRHWLRELCDKCEHRLRAARERFKMLERLEGLPLYQLRALYRLNLGSISSGPDNTREHELYNVNDVIFDAMQKRLEAIRKKPSLAKTELRDQKVGLTEEQAYDLIFRESWGRKAPPINWDLLEDEEIWNQRRLAIAVSHQHDREKIYQEVWSEPITQIAKRYGVSDVAFRKRCRKLMIPLPGLGYWAKKAAGKPVQTQPPLPDLSVANEDY